MKRILFALKTYHQDIVFRKLENSLISCLKGILSEDRQDLNFDDAANAVISARFYRKNRSPQEAMTQFVRIAFPMRRVMLALLEGKLLEIQE